VIEDIKDALLFESNYIYRRSLKIG